MAVPSSGELELRGDIALEVYGSATGNNISLGAMSDLAGFPAPDAMSDFYGYSSADAPSVTTNNISNVGETSVTLNGNVTSDGGATVTQRGFYFGTNSSSPTNNTKYTVSGTTGYYSLNRTGLSASTTYYCWAFATNSEGTTYGSRVQATTIAAFVPTYVVSGTSANFITAYANSSSEQTYRFRKYYRNPNTNSLIQFYSFQETNYGTQLSRGFNFYSGNQVCTNAENTFSSGFTMFPNSIVNLSSHTMDVETTGGYSISNTSRDGTYLAGTPNISVNTSSRYRITGVTGNQTSDPVNQLFMTQSFNYS